MEIWLSIVLALVVLAAILLLQRWQPQHWRGKSGNDSGGYLVGDSGGHRHAHADHSSDSGSDSGGDGGGGGGGE